MGVGKAQKNRIFDRDKGRSQYCGTRLNKSLRHTWNIDHFVPQVKGGCDQGFYKQAKSLMDLSVELCLPDFIFYYEGVDHER